MATEDDAPDTSSPAWALLMEALEPAEPPATVRRALTAATFGPARYLPFVPSMSCVFDVDADAARGLLMRAADRAQWTQGKPPFSAHMDFAGGPDCGDLRAGFVIMEPNTVIPRHRHTDREVTLVLEGSIKSGARTYGPGDILEMPQCSEHVFEVGSDGAIFAVLRGRIEFLG